MTVAMVWCVQMGRANFGKSKARFFLKNVIFNFPKKAPTICINHFGDVSRVVIAAIAPSALAHFKALRAVGAR